MRIEQLNDALEGDWKGTHWFVRAGDTSQSLTVNYTVGGTATSGTDYTALGGSVTFAAGAFVAALEVDASTDGSSDPNETVVATIDSGSGYTIDMPSSATVTIIDSATPFISVAAIDDGTEGGGNGKFRFTRTGSTSATLTVNYTVSGTATSGSDYTALSGSVTFAIGSATADVTVTVTNDSADESLEHITASITPGSGYAINAASATMTITDNDLPEVTVAKIVDAAEGGGNGIFRFSRTGGDSSQQLTVSYTVGGTASAGTDYSTLGGTVTIAANALTADVVVVPVPDGNSESTETVTITIGTDTEYTIGTPSSASLDLRDETAGGISGQMWIDNDGDGTKDTGEVWFEAGDVYLMKAGEVVACAVTAASGTYSFTGLAAGTYTINFDVPGGFEPTVTQYGEHQVTVTAGTVSSGVSEGCQPTTPAPANTPDPAAGVPGIKWSTLAKGDELTMFGVQGHNYTVELQQGGKQPNRTITLFMANPADTQPAPIRNANPGLFINNNCHGLSMDLTAIVKDGRYYTFAVFDDLSTMRLWTTLYRTVSPKEAKDLLAKGKTVTCNWVAAGNPPPQLHSVKVKTIKLTANDELNLAESTCDSKAGWLQVEQNTTLKAIDDFWKKPPTGPAAQAYQLYTKKD